MGFSLAHGQHLALIGFMGAGKSMVGAEVARLLNLPFVDLDAEIERGHGPISALFERGEAVFRRLEAEALAQALDAWPSVIALGGGALGSPENRRRVLERSFPVLIEVDPEAAWNRVRRSDRPLARDEGQFRRLYEEREPIYREVARAVARDADGVLLAAADIVVERGGLGRLAELLPDEDETSRGQVALIGDERVLELHEPKVGERLASVHRVPAGETAKSLAVVEGLWNELTLGRDGLILAVGGGATTDVAGFVAATYLRGVAWVAVPTTLVGQVDAAIGGKTAVNLAKGKNLAGAFHRPIRVIADPDVLETLPGSERRAGMAEVVKTGLLAGRELWREQDEAMVRGCAAFKAAVCISDPAEGGRRAILNLGHTFAHALEAGAGYGRVSHGDAVALGLTAALRLSENHYGLDSAVREEVERVLEPKPVRADSETAWAALKHDKKALAGRTRLVLLEAPGRPVYGIELPDEEVRAALAALIAE